MGKLIRGSCKGNFSLSGYFEIQLGKFIFGGKLSKQYKVYKGETVRYETSTGKVLFNRISRVTDQTDISIKLGKGGSIEAEPKVYGAGEKAPRRAWVDQP